MKITVIATGFQPENEPKPKPRTQAVESRPAVVFEPPPPVEIPEPEYVEPPPVAAAPPSRPLPPKQPNGYDADDLDTPAYLRQGKLLN